MAIQEELKKKQQYLDSTSPKSFMPQSKPMTDVEGVEFRGPKVGPYSMPTSLDEAMFGAKRPDPEAVMTATNITSKPTAQNPVIAQPGAAPRVENSLNNDNPLMTDKQIVAGVRKRTIDSQSFSPGSGVVINNGTGSVTDVGYGARPPINDSPAGNGFGAYASDLAKQSQDIMNSDVQSFTSEDGTSVSQGASAVGAGIVSRGLLNRSKAFADMSNQQQTTENTGFGIRSLAEDRNRSNTREDAKALTDIQGKEMEQSQIRRVNDLQQQFLTETDPAKKRQISEQLTALTGKTTDKFQPVIGKDDLGNSVFLGAFDTRSGDYREQGPSMSQQQHAPQGAIDMLRKDPSLAPAFQQKYGYLPQ